MRKRCCIVCGMLVAMILLGVLYGVWCEVTHLGVPCLFHKITGKYCPGCGITRMCLNLLKLDFKAAFRSNAAIFMMLPIGGIIALRWIISYIIYDQKQFTKLEEQIFIGMVVLLVGFGLLRNLDCFKILCPL